MIRSLLGQIGGWYRFVIVVGCEKSAVCCWEVFCAILVELCSTLIDQVQGSIRQRMMMWRDG